MKSSYLVTGNKGGTGKSLTVMALVDYLLERGEQVLIIDQDHMVPDVKRMYAGKFPGQLEWTQAIIQGEPSCTRYINIMKEERYKNWSIVTNTPAGAELLERLDTLRDGVRELPNHEFITLWLLNTQFDATDSLRKYAEAMPGFPIHIVQNLHPAILADPRCPPEIIFEMFQKSNLKKALEQRGSRCGFMPSLNEDVTKLFYNYGKPPSQLMQELPGFDRACLRRWRRDMAEMFDQLFGLAVEEQAVPEVIGVDDL
jgi:hypothetical protein